MAEFRPGFGNLNRPRGDNGREQDETAPLSAVSCRYMEEGTGEASSFVFNDHVARVSVGLV
jgi:hypothetical protein